MTDPDRRPIAARNLPIMHRIAGWLVRREASANGISIAGMIAALVAGLCFAATAWLPDAARLFWLLGAILVQARLLANLLDGMVAIGRGIAPSTGELFNEIPDRVSDTAVLVGVGLAAGQPTLGVFAALAAMATAYVRAVGRSLGQTSDFSGPMAKQQRMALVTGLGVAGLLLPAAWTLTLAMLVLWAITLGAAFTAARRLSHIAKALRA